MLSDGTLRLVSLDLDALLDPFLAWAQLRPDVLAVALMGSRARGTPRPDSDVDLILLVHDQAAFRPDTWLGAIDFERPGYRVESWHDVNYGAVWSRHVLLAPAIEVEFTFALPAWAAVDPVDPDTRAIVLAGFQILIDKDSLFATLRDQVL